MTNYPKLSARDNSPTDEELAQAMYEVAGVYVEGGEYHCRRGDMPRIARNVLAKYGAPTAQQDASAAQAVPDERTQNCAPYGTPEYDSQEQFNAGWNACRDAMISAQPSEQAQLNKGG